MAELILAKSTDTFDGGCACVYSTNVGGSQTNSSQVLYTQAGPCPCPDVYPGDNSVDTNAVIDYNNDNFLRERQKQTFMSEGTVLSEISRYYRGFKNVAKAEISKIKKSLSSSGRNLLGLSKKEIKSIVSKKTNNSGSLRQLTLKQREALKVNILENSKRFAKGFNAGTPTSFIEPRDYYVKYEKNRKATEARKQNHQGLYGLSAQNTTAESVAAPEVQPVTTATTTSSEPVRREPVTTKPVAKPVAKPAPQPKKPISKY